VACWVALCLVVPHVLRAQVPTGGVVGTVRASTGTGLPGATVTIRDSATASVRPAITPSGRSTVTQADGTYSFAELPLAATYELEASLNGFATVVHSSVSAIAGQRVVVDFTLYAATSEALVVTGRAATLEHERSTVQQMVGEPMMHALPLASRDFLAMSSLAAGFTGSATAPSPQGQFYWGNNVIVDGASHYSKWRGAPRTFYSGYGLESIREVQVLSNQFSAEYGEALATVTVAVTNSGTDTLRGSALLFVQDDALNDIPAFAPTEPPFSSQRYGFTLGGPVVKNQTHFFASYEGRRTRGSNIVVSPVADGAHARNDDDEHVAFFKVDHKASTRDLLTARYNGQWFTWHNEPGGLTLPGSGTEYTNDNHTLLFSDTTLISSRMLNQVRMQFSRFKDVRADVQPSLYVQRNGYSAEGATYGPRGFGANPESTWEGADTLSYRAGAHTFKAGGGMKYVRLHTDQLTFERGAYYFAGPPSFSPEPFAFVQGLAPSDAATAADPHSMAVYGFAQDDWSLASRVTLDIGLRYDVERISNLDHYDAPTDKNNLQPRLGVAWDVIPGRTVVRGGVGIYTQQQLLGYISSIDLQGADGGTILYLAPGASLMPTYPNILPPSVPVLPPRDIQVLDSSFRNPHSMQATVGVEQTLFGMIVGADVMHLRGYDLFSLVDTNAPASVHEPASRTVAEADATRPITPVPNGFRKIIALGNEGASWYRALQIKADKSKGPVQTIVAYTWSRSEDQANYVLPEDSRNLDAEKGRADNDIRHNLSVGLTWQMPGGRRGLNGLMLSGFGVFRSNRPYTVTWGDDRNGTSQNDARPGGRNTASGGIYRTVDLSLAKLFRVARTSIEARVEAFNVFSATNDDQFEGVLSSPFFGQPVTAFPRRRIQLAALVRF